MVRPVNSLPYKPASMVTRLLQKTKFGAYGLIAAAAIGSFETVETQSLGRVAFGGENGFWNQTDPDEVKNPKRNYTRDRLNEDIKDKWFYEQWYKIAKFNLSLSDHINFARNYNDLPIDEYIKLWVKNENESSPLSGKICRAYVPRNPSEKPIYVLVLGNSEKLDKDPNYSGVVDLYDKLVKDDKGIVLLFRTGFVKDELNTWLNCEGQYAYDKDVVFEHTKNIISYFANKYKPEGVKEFRMLGYSRGGGTLSRLASDYYEDWRQGLPVAVTIMLDAVDLDCTSLGGAVRERPLFDESYDHKHFHIYEKPYINPYGGPISDLVKVHGDSPIKVKYYWKIFYKTVLDKGPNDVVWQVSDATHGNIDDLETVRQWLWEYLVNY
ncbi:MAG: hypothetical protein HYZ79_05890 [Candidatus Melainabacteria bacterium]|nr:hypothetical protein [Candidatus Melainabacteria bacterium]